MRGALSFIIGTILGALIGASLAILLAPTSGQQLRDQIGERTRNFSQEVEMAAQTRRAELEKQLAQLRAPAKSSNIQVQ